tara:strand:+ start:62498 stop:62854 length:357 start_codon:yes stop_codon:yes gene_type:complete
MPIYIKYIILIFFLLNGITAYFLTVDIRFAWITGYLLGLFTVAFHLFTSLFTNKKVGASFFRHYYMSLFLRFLIICILYIFILTMIKIDEFSFTVSFIISYLFHSVNEVIFLNKKLSN